MSLLLIAALATQLQELPTCKQLLIEYESQLKEWSAAPRTITAKTEEHRYHSVSKKGVTTTLVILAAIPPEPQMPYRYGFEAIRPCYMNNAEATIYYKVLKK